MKALLRKIRQILKDRRTRRIFTRVVSGIAAFIVFVTTYALVLPAITMESEAACGIPAHQHDDSCYEEVLTCDLPESDGHTHDESCYTVTEKLVCGLEEHVHSPENGCYDEEGNLICQLQEHTHTADCYKEEKTLSCGLEESEGHHHNASCYDKVLTCGLEAHVHSAECYRADHDSIDSNESSAVAASTGAAAVEIGNGDANSVLNTAEGSASGSAPLTDDSSAAATTGVLPETIAEENLSEGYVPTLDSLNMDAVLTQKTGFYYYHAEDNAETPANSEQIDSWKKLKDNDPESLAPADMVRAYFAYTIPAGSLNETNQIARYRLPSNLHLTDEQIIAINKTENGLAGQFIDYDTLEITDSDKYDLYLGAEAVEGKRTPDQDLDEDAQEYISAVVKAENVYDEEGLYGEKGAYLGQDLIFIFTPYTIEKNQNTYDADGNPTAAGKKVSGWFSVDFNTSQVDWDEPVEASTDAEADSEETEVEADSEQADGNQADVEEAAVVTRTAEVIFVSEDRSEGIKEISEKLTMIEKIESEKTADDPDADGEDETASAGITADEAADDAADGMTADKEAEEEEKSAADATAEAADAASTDAAAEGETGEAAAEEEAQYDAGILTESGKGYDITLEYTAEAGIPADAKLRVAEITAESDPEAYEACLEQARQSVTGRTADDKAAVDETATRFFDIEIIAETADGETQKIEPKCPVSVNIRLDKPAENHEAAGNKPAASQDPTVLHFAEDGVETIENAETTETAESAAHDETAESAASADNQQDTGTAIQFEAESFSIYGVVYTVDFAYDGYMISIPGNASILLSDLAAELSLPGADGKGSFDVDQVKNISFTDDSLVRVSKIEATMTVEELLTQLDQEGVLTWLARNVVVRTEDKSDDEVIAEANAIEQVDPSVRVYAGDWLLTGLQAFHTDEELVITLKTGEKYVVNVTDLDTATNGVKPKTITGYDSASAGITITMFDYGPDKLDNVNNTYKSTDNSGINSGHDLKFYSYGTEGSTINNFTGGAYAMQGVVKSGLVDGYPVTSKSGENLGYLFNDTPSGNNKKVYKDVNRLFLYDDNTGLMHYSSDENYAYMNPNPNSSGGYDFTLYKDTYTEEGADYANPFRIGFFPYNDYDNRYRCIHGDNFRWGCKGQNDWRVRDQVGHYNHHFGMKVDGTFYMTDDKKTPKGDQDMIFEFSGDDDMWVFVDGVLVLDIGGIHNPVDGKINFTTGEVTVSAAKTASGGGSYALGTNTTIADAFAKYNANKAATDPVKTWDDSPLSQHDIKIFYMERGGMYSNLEISMNLPTFPAPKHVELCKVNRADESEGLAGAQFELYSDYACTKPIKATGTDSPVIITSATNPVKGSVLIENLVPGQTYYLKEIQAPEGYKLDNRVFKIVAPANDDTSEAQIFIATSETEVEQLPNHNIPNTKDTYGSFDFFKVKEGDPNTKIPGAQFTLYTDLDCTTVAKNKEGNNLQATSDSGGKVSFIDIPAGKTYYMKETAEPNDYFPSSDVYTVEVDAAGKVTVKLGTEEKFTSDSGGDARQITNKPKTQNTSISVDKSWKDGAANHTNDTVTVQLYKLETNSTTVKVNWSGDPSSDAKVKVTFSAPNYDDVVVNLANGGWEQSVDLVADVKYTVTYEASGENVSGVDGSNTFTAAPNGTYQLTGTLKAKKINVPVTITWPAGTTIPDGTTVNVKITDNDHVEADQTVGFPTSSGWSSSVELTEGKSYTISYECSDGVSVTGTANSLIVASGSRIDATGTVTNGKMNLTIVYVYSDAHIDASASPHSFTGITVDGNQDWGNQYKIETIEDKKIYKVNEIKVLDSNQNELDYQFYANPSNCSIVQATATGNLDVNYNTTNNILSLTAKPGNYTIYILDEGMTAPSSLSSAPASRRSSNRSVKNAPLRAPVPQENFLNGTHKLPAGATAEGAPVVLNEDHDGRWSYTWTGLTSESNGTKTTYYVVETGVDLENGDNSDVVSSSYKYVYNVEGDETSGIKTVIITNEVQPKTSLEVTKRWLKADGSQVENPEAITFKVHQVVGNQDKEYPDSQTTHTITYDTEAGAYNTVTVPNLPKKVKDGDELKDASYYVVETSPAGNENLTTYYEAGGKQYADPADVAASKATSVEIVNKNVSREITVTKEWRYKNGSRVTVADEPPEKDVYFKLKKIVDGQDPEYFTVTDAATGVPESDATPNDYVSYSNAGSNGTIYHLICTSTTTEHVSELDPNETYTTTSWAWNTLTFNNLPTGCKYVLVETDREGRELLSDAVGTQITYVDENGKLMTETNPIDPAIPGNYTIRNTEHRTSLYAQKVWQGANKDNLAGNESVWFSLMRVETDGNGGYDWTTLKETPGIGRFALKESSGWVKYFDSIEVAPPERHASDPYKYYQYFIVELGLLDQNTADQPDDQKTYSLINNLFIRYQSKGSGTAADGSVAEGRDEFKPYSQSVDLAADNNVTGSRKVDDWINLLKSDSTLESNFVENDMIRLRTWAENYDGMGTLGAFNSSQQFLTNPLEITKVWKDAEGKELTPEDKAKINKTDGDGDHYQVEIQLMQHAYDLQGKDSTLTYDVPYGSTFMVDPTNVIMQSDLFEVSKRGDGLWNFEIKAMNAAGENQLPLTGPFRIPGSGETVQAHFEYYVSEYRVYNNDGNDETTLWSAACKKNTSGSTYSLELENRKTTDLVLYKSWKEVPAENRTWVNDNVQAVLFKVWRKAPDEEEATDITEYIAARPRSYDLTSANVFDVELDGVYEDFVRIDKPTDGWAITDDGSADATVTINNLDALVKDYVTEENNLSKWPRYQYWVEEWGYVDAKGSFQFIETLLHGNTKSTADYPKYQKSTGSATATLTDEGTAGYGSSAAIAKKPDATTIGKSAVISLGTTGQNHLGAVNTVRGLELTIIKTDNSATPKKLTNAQFVLKQKNSEGSWLPFTYSADTDADASTSDVKVETADGKFKITAENGYIIKNLMPGQYKLEEVKAPDGYIIQFSPIEFEVTPGGKIVAPGTTTELTGGTDKHFTYTAGTTTGKSSGTITVQNEPGKELPASGGPGTGMIYALGGILTVFAGILLGRKRIRQ